MIHEEQVYFARNSSFLVSMTDAQHVPLYFLPPLKKGIFLKRLNRFAAEIRYQGRIETAHVHDPGRLKELLTPGASILFTPSAGKLAYYIRTVHHQNELVLIDSAQHSKIAHHLFLLLHEFSHVKNIQYEVPIGRSRIDFTLDGIPLEVKGATLVKNGIALFPDAPTQRGTCYVREIIQHEGIILFLIFKKAKAFAPNEKMDHAFATALKTARKKGIPIHCFRICFDGTWLHFGGKIPFADF
ncbi:MAG: DNA/RNA nuclease SfsA [Promethearchaeota archaeon]